MGVEALVFGIAGASAEIGLLGNASSALWVSSINGVVRHPAEPPRPRRFTLEAFAAKGEPRYLKAVVYDYAADKLGSALTEIK